MCNDDLGCADDNIIKCVKITCTRNPKLQPDPVQYQEVLMSIFTSIRKAYPSITAIIEKQTVDMGFYVPVPQTT